jgi:transposase InsO family protein
MPWKKVSTMDLREEFVHLCLLEGANRRELCRRFGISAQTGYKWLNRHVTGDALGFSDRSRRPHESPGRVAGEVEERILDVRAYHPAWGARKIRAFLAAAGQAMPAVSTVHQVLVRHGLILLPEGGAAAQLRFEAEAPNDLWQMDFKGWSRLGDGTALHPLTIIDDHSRFSPCLRALPNETGRDVQAALTDVFRIHGLPLKLFTDNGNPWGSSQRGGWSRFGVWLLKLGVRLIHSRPYHPQSRGKNERFHRSLDVEVFNLRPLHNQMQAQKAFDEWRPVYNHQRPHEALGMAVPASRWRPSPRAFPEKLPAPDYDAGEITRMVSSTKGYVSFKGQLWRVPDAFCGERLAIRPLRTDGHHGIFFAAHQIATIDLTNKQTVSHVSEQVSTMSPV